MAQNQNSAPYLVCNLNVTIAKSNKFPADFRERLLSASRDDKARALKFDLWVGGTLQEVTLADGTKVQAVVGARHNPIVTSKLYESNSGNITSRARLNVYNAEFNMDEIDRKPDAQQRGAGNAQSLEDMVAAIEQRDDSTEETAEA